MLCLYAYIREYDCVWAQNHLLHTCMSRAHDDIIVIDVAMMTSLLLMLPWWYHRYWYIDVTMRSWYVHCVKRQKLWAEAARLWDKNDYPWTKAPLWGENLALKTVWGMRHETQPGTEGRCCGPAGQTLAMRLRWRPLGLAVHTSESALRSSRGIPGRSTARRATAGKKEVIFMALL